MRKEKEIRAIWIDMALLFVIAMLPRVVMIFTLVNPMRTPMDEMSTLAAGAWFGGADWTAATEYGNHYYGGGFTILMAPLFRMIHNPYTLYRACLTVCAAVQSLVAPIACLILHRYMKIRRRSWLYFASLISSFLVVNRALVVYNEHMIVLVTWLIALLLCMLIAETDKEKPDYRKKALYSVLLMLVLSYSLTLHTRSKTLWIALVLLVILYYLMYKKWLVAKLPALISGAAGYYLAGRFIYWCKTTLWLWQEGEELRNTAVRLNLSWELLTSPISWQGWLATVVGQVHTSMIFTGGFSAIAITLLAIYICRNGSDMFRKKKHPVTEHPEQLQVKPYLLVLGVFFAMCIGATILAQSVTWLFRVYDALKNSPYDKKTYGYKAFTYFRYYGAYMGPFFLAGMGYLHHYRQQLKKYLPAAFAVFAGFQVLFLCTVLPHITKSMVASEVYWPFGLHRSFDVPMRTLVYLAGVAVCSVSFLVMFAALCKGRGIIPLALLLGLLLYQYGYNGIYWDGENYGRYHVLADAGSSLILEMEAQGCELPEELYTAGVNPSKPTKPIYIYQVLLKDYRLLPAAPDASVEEAVVLCPKKKYKKLLNDGYRYAVLDENECIYVKGEKYISMFENYGVSLKK